MNTIHLVILCHQHERYHDSIIFLISISAHRLLLSIGNFLIHNIQIDQTFQVHLSVESHFLLNIMTSIDTH